MLVDLSVLSPSASTSIPLPSPLKWSLAARQGGPAQGEDTISNMSACASYRVLGKSSEKKKVVATPLLYNTLQLQTASRFIPRGYTQARDFDDERVHCCS